MSGRRILITGGAGFIGARLADHLLASGHAVRVLDDLSPQVHGPGAGRPAYLDRQVELLFTSTNKVYGALEDVPLVDAGSRYAPVDPGLHRGISEARGLAFHSPYGCSRGAAEQYVLDWARTYGVPATAFRMSCRRSGSPAGTYLTSAPSRTSWPSEPRAGRRGPARPGWGRSRTRTLACPAWDERRSGHDWWR